MRRLTSDCFPLPMSSEGLSTVVKGFIRGYIHSVTEIEILALVQAAPDREWTARAIDQVLRSNEQSVASRLFEFARAGLLAELGGTDKTYRYQPQTEALAAAVAETVQDYRTRPVLVIETIFKPDD